MVENKDSVTVDCSSSMKKNSFQLNVIKKQRVTPAAGMEGTPILVGRKHERDRYFDPHGPLTYQNLESDNFTLIKKKGKPSPTPLPARQTY